MFKHIVNTIKIYNLNIKHGPNTRYVVQILYFYYLYRYFSYRSKNRRNLQVFCLLKGLEIFSSFVLFSSWNIVWVAFDTEDRLEQLGEGRKKSEHENRKRNEFVC